MMQLPMFKPECAWKPPKISKLPSWKNASRIAIDVETCDPLLKKFGPGVRRGAYIAGYSFTIEDGESFYIPVRHSEDNVVEGAEAAFDYLRQQAKDFTGTLCGANMQYDLDFLAQQKVVFKNVGWFRDCQIAEPLIDELQMSYSLQAIAERHGIPGKDESLLRDAAAAYKIDPKKEMFKLPARFVAAYAMQDTELPLQLLRRQERVIDEQDLWEVYNLESRVLPVLVKMRRRGVKINFDQLDHVENWALQEETQHLNAVHDLTGIRIGVGDVWKAKELEKAMIAIGVEVPRTKTGLPSIDKFFLGKLDHPVAEHLEHARKANKVRTTFAHSIREHAIGDRIHCTFNQLRKTDDSDDDSNGKGARYGRLSSSDPNLQQQPSRPKTLAKLWRSIYVPDGDGLWAACDYSQQEPRMLVHFAELARCRGASKAGDKYRQDPNADNHTMMARMIYGYGEDEEPTADHRTHAKIIFLGLCYSMGGAKLAKGLNLPTKFIQTRSGKTIEVAGDKAKAIIDQFDRQVPFVKQLAQMCEKRAKQVGYIKTLSGRRCRFPVDQSGHGFDWTHKALNRLIQGSSADQTKMAMVAADEAGYKMQLQVHDEIDLTVASPQEGEQIGKIMRECVALNVPSKVDVEIGPSWGEAK